MSSKNIMIAAICLGASLSLTACKDKAPKSQNVTTMEAPQGMVSLCGNPNILGTKADPISKGACGIQNPVSVHYVNGVKLSAPALVNCKTATTVADWVSNSLQPAASQMGKSVKNMYVMASYSCRTRNHKKGAKLSEHSYGNAIDIGGFTFDDGTKVTLLEHYYARPYKRFMSDIRKGACGPFGTVLGPGTDKLHANHFHFDVASYSMGAYCK